MVQTPRSTKSKVPFKKDAVNLEELNKSLPDQPFIAVFGTSHTYGSCIRGDQIVLKESDIWYSVLAKRMGLPVVNFAVPGNNNLRMQMQMMDFLEMENSKYCEHVFCELRLSDGAYCFTRDVFTDELQKFENNPEIAGGQHYRYNSFWENFFTTVAVSKYHKTDYLAQCIENSHRDSNYVASKTQIETLAEITKAKGITHFSSIQGYIEDLISVRTMQRLVKLKGAKFTWFCWDNKLDGLSEALMNDVNSYFKEHTDIFNDKLLHPNLRQYIMDVEGEYNGNTMLIQNECECSHHNEIVHAWVADRIYEGLNE